MRLPKYRKIFNSLHSDILEGKFDKNGTLPSEEFLCRKWDVSRPTVARALRELQMQGLIDRRAGSGTYLRAEKRPVQTTLGLLAEGLGKTEILDPICAEITRAAQQRGCGVFTGGLPPGKSAESIASEWFANGVRGVFFAPIEHPSSNRQTLNREIVTAFKNAEIAVVLIDRDTLEFPQKSDFDLVAIDNFHAGYELGRHLSETGSERVALIAKPDYPSTTDLRLNGLQEGLRYGGVASLDFHVGDPENADFMKTLYRPQPIYDTFVCSNDQTAARFMQSAFALGFRVPTDFKLAGFDDISLASLLPVPLTTIHQPCRSIGICCVDAMIGRLRHPELPPRSILLRGTLVVRQSTGTLSGIHSTG